MRIALAVEYDGSRFSGWQAQESARTVQETLEKAVSFVANHPVKVFCSGRTDKGVHAYCQVVHFDTEAVRAEHSWLFGINSQLPDEVSVYWLQVVDDDFHARFSAKARRYRYVVMTSRTRSCLMHDRVAWHRHQLDVGKMQQGLNYLLGEHDFSAFRAVGCQAHSPVREMQLVKVERQGNLIAIELQANGFLYHMVRNIVGSLFKVGQGEQPPEWMRELLVGRDRTKAAATAPAGGLYFVKAVYDGLEIPDNPLLAS